MGGLGVGEGAFASDAGRESASSLGNIKTSVTNWIKLVCFLYHQAPEILNKVVDQILLPTPEMHHFHPCTPLSTGYNSVLGTKLLSKCFTSLLT